ncbi:MAG: hypothetical protein AAF386_08810 [Pseudomonadota bacterium]
MSESKIEIEIENVNTPGQTAQVNAAKYTEMRRAYLNGLTDTAPGMTADEAKEAAKQTLSADLFPNGATSGWWAKTVQLDLEAKGIVARSNTKPLRFYKTGPE